MMFFGTLLLARLFKFYVEDKFFRFKMIFLHQHGQRAETNKQTNQKNLACPDTVLPVLYKHKAV